jgi:hypothetical protein
MNTNAFTWLPPISTSRSPKSISSCWPGAVSNGSAHLTGSNRHGNALADQPPRHGCLDGTFSAQTSAGSR